MERVDQETKAAYHNMAQMAWVYDREIRDLSEELLVDDRNHDLLHELLDIRLAAHKASLLGDAILDGADVDYEVLEKSLTQLSHWVSGRKRLLRDSVRHAVHTSAASS